MSSMKIRMQAIKELEDRHGRVTAERLVQEARSKTHPLHKDFRWDDKDAAYHDRLNTARQIISSVRVIITHSRKKISSVAYVRDPSLEPNEQGYVSVSKLRTERESALEAILSEVSRVQSILERAQELAFALDLQDEFAEALAAATTLKSRLRRGPALEPLEEGYGASLS
jgi:hypothetical protein